MSPHRYLIRLSNALDGARDKQLSNRLERSLGLLQRRLRRHFPEQLDEALPFGSYKRGTMLCREADPARDVDVLVVFRDRELKPDTAVERLRPFMKDAYARSDFGRDAPAFALRLQHIRFELVPALRKPGGEFSIPDTRSQHRNWISTCPWRFAATLERVRKAQEPYLPQVIRLLKYWNVRHDRPMTSYALEQALVTAAADFGPRPETGQLLITRSLVRAVDALELAWNATPHARRVLTELKEAMKEVAHHSFLQRHDAAREVLAATFPLLPSMQRQTQTGASAHRPARATGVPT